MSEEMFKIAFEFNKPENIFHKIRIDKIDYDLKDEAGIKYFEIPKSVLNENGELEFEGICVTKKNIKNDENDEEKKQTTEYITKNQKVYLDQNKNFFLINASLNESYKKIYNVTGFENSDEFNKAVKNSYTTFVIVAPKNYDINHYQMLINDVKDNDISFNGYGTSAFNFTFNKENDEYKFTVVTFPINLNEKQLYLYSNDPNTGNADKNLFKDQQYLPIFPDKGISNDTDDIKFVQIVLEEERHVDLVAKVKSLEVELKFSPLTKEMAELARIDIESLPHETIEEKKKQNENNDKATENDEILLNIYGSNEKVNAFLLNGKPHFISKIDHISHKESFQYGTSNLEKNKEYKIELAYYDKEKGKFYYFPESIVYKFNTFHIKDNLIQLYIEDNLRLSFENNDALKLKPIYHENQANTELSFGAIFTAGIIICSIFLGIGMLAPIIAWPLIAGCTILATVLLSKGGYDDSKIYTPPKEDKSQEPETENSDESNPTFNPDFGNPIWPEENPSFNESDSKNSKPIIDDIDPFIAEFEEEWPEDLIIRNKNIR